MSKVVPPSYYHQHQQPLQQPQQQQQQPVYYHGGAVPQQQVTPVYAYQYGPAPQAQAPYVQSAGYPQQQQYMPPQGYAPPHAYVPPQQYNQSLLPPGGVSDQLPQPHVGAPSHNANIGTNTKCRDKVCATIFLLHLIGFITFGGITIDKWRKSRNIHTGGYSLSTLGDYLVADVVVSAIVGVIFSIAYIRFAMSIRGRVVAFSFGIQTTVLLVITAIYFVYDLQVAAIITAFIALLTVLVYFCVRRRIPFTEAILHNSMRGLTEYWGVFVASLVLCFVSVLYLIFWLFTTLIAINQYYGDRWKREEASIPLGLAVFLLFLEVYWTTQVLRNISHTTTAGAIGTWWYQPGANSGVTSGAFKRASTTSLGSIALGSFLVAVLQALKSMVKGSRNSQSLAACILVCILACLERIMRYFNMYAYTQVALYGKDFITAAKDTMDLFESKGFTMIINDDLTSVVISAAVSIVALCSALIVGIPIFAKIRTLDTSSSDTELFVVAVLVSLLMAAWLSSVVLAQIQSAVCTTFVVWAEDPDQVQQNRAMEYREIEDARTTLPAIENPANR